MKTLYIFVTSDRPDQYLNPIVYCINKEQVRRIIFVEIKNPHAGKQVEASSICRDVYDLAYQLSQGKYKYYVGNARGNEVSLDPHYSNSEILKLINQYDSYLVGGISWDSHTVDYTCLKQFIYNLNNLKGQLIIDISCVSKSYIGDILSCCLLKNIKDLYVFDLLKEHDFIEPWKMLIHGLTEKVDFEYIPITKTTIFQENLKAILIRSTPVRVAISTTLIFVILALIANFLLGNNSIILQAFGVINTVLGIIAFVLIFLPPRGA